VAQFRQGARRVVQASLPFGRLGGEHTPGIAPASLTPIFVRHPRAKRYVLRVERDGTVRVTIPRSGSKREAQAFAERERGWIDKELGRLVVERLSPSAAHPSIDEERALRQQAKRDLPRRLYELAARFELSVSRVSVRNQRWRWGSCSRRGHICLNWRLVQTPTWVCDYVLIHELMHLKRLDHSPAFWRLVAQACPAYKEAKAWLRSARDGSRREPE
jgi:predicted metal-dependent hydrolase